jgi:hypothetical protein
MQSFSIIILFYPSLYFSCNIKNYHFLHWDDLDLLYLHVFDVCFDCSHHQNSQLYDWMPQNPLKPWDKTYTQFLTVWTPSLPLSPLPLPFDSKFVFDCYRVFFKLRKFKRKTLSEFINISSINCHWKTKYKNFKRKVSFEMQF